MGLSLDSDSDVYEYEDELEEDTTLFKSDAEHNELNAAMTSMTIMSDDSPCNPSNSCYTSDSSAEELDKNNLGAIKKSSLKIDYLCLTAEGIYHLMLKRAEKLQPIFKLSSSTVSLLLQKYKWSEERLLEAYMEDSDGVLDSVGVRSYTQVNNQINDRKYFLCPVCCEESGSVATFALECGHEYCIGCYRHYVQGKINDGKVIRCMGCEVVLKNEDINIIMGDSTSSYRLAMSSIRAFIEKHNDYYKWCPYADCGSILYIKDMLTVANLHRQHKLVEVTCDNKHTFCFRCSLEVHSPCNCAVASLWVKKAQLESENISWVLHNTKECPKCSVKIEKNGGCNHMTCRRCSYEFCWVCESDWSTHSGSYYRCVVYDGKKHESPIKNTKRYLHKYSHYYKNFNIHESSAQMDMKLGHTVELKVKSLQDNLGISWIEGQFIPESISKLVTSRTVLKWSFALSYFADHSHNMYKIFEQNQMELSKAVEDLSQLLLIKDPQEIMDRKREFYNVADFVWKRRNALAECGRELLMKGICTVKET